MKNKVSIKYINVEKEIYDRAITNIRSGCDLTHNFSITLVLYLGSTLHPFYMPQ